MREYAKATTPSHACEAHIVSRALSKRYHQETGLQTDPRGRALWNHITRSRNQHPIFAHDTQLDSMIHTMSESSQRQSIMEDQVLEYAIIQAKHVSLLPKPLSNTKDVVKRTMEVDDNCMPKGVSHCKIRHRPRRSSSTLKVHQRVAFTSPNSRSCI